MAEEIGNGGMEIIDLTVDGSGKMLDLSALPFPRKPSRGVMDDSLQKVGIFH